MCVARTLCALVLALHAGASAALASGGSALQRMLSRTQPSLLVEFTQDDPAAAWDLDVEGVSAQLRGAGAAALIVPPTLLDTVVGEQGRAKGDFPGPVPVLCDIGAEASPVDTVAALKERGAAGAAVRCPEGVGLGGLGDLAGALAEAELPLIVVAGDEEALTAGAAAGAIAVACAFSVSQPEAEALALAADGAAPTVVLGGWDGDGDTLQRLRDAGFTNALLLDGCGGDIRAGGGWCASRVTSFKTKASRQWGGSMFGSTSDDAAPPGARNPRAWAQSQRQAREIMHESAKSRGLAPPKLKRNTVL